jgi:ATP-dependent DNA ligase
MHLHVIQLLTIYLIHLLESSRVSCRVLPRDQPLIEEALCVVDRGLELYRHVQNHDLEGVIAKRKDGTYSTDTPWLKFKNPATGD